MIKENSGHKKRKGDFEREAILNMVGPILIILSGLLAAYVFPYIIKLFRN
jgi:hypothetical protein